MYSGYLSRTVAALQTIKPHLEAAGEPELAAKIDRLPALPRAEEGAQHVINTAHEIIAVFIDVARAVEGRPELQHLKPYLSLSGTAQ